LESSLLWLILSRYGQNCVNIFFRPPFLVIMWAESVKFWGFLFLKRLEKSEIYKIRCSKTQRCGHQYIGQIKRQAQKRFVQHLQAFKNRKPRNSAVAAHMITKEGEERRFSHNFDHTCLKWIKEANDSKKLDAFESFYTFKETKPTNFWTWTRNHSNPSFLSLFDIFSSNQSNKGFCFPWYWCFENDHMEIEMHQF
jgi:hypothetical protein